MTVSLDTFKEDYFNEYLKYEYLPDCDNDFIRTRSKKIGYGSS